eukprot:2163398-Rhodomonas_salina.1
MAAVGRLRKARGRGNASPGSLASQRTTKSCFSTTTGEQLQPLFSSRDGPVPASPISSMHMCEQLVVFC